MSVAVHTYFNQLVTSPEELRELLGEPAERSRLKEMQSLDQHCKAFIAHAPFVLIGTANALGQCDVSPKGDEPGFVRVLDDRTLLIPDRPGNKRFDGLRNILENPHIGLLFLIPNVQETLRVNGRACIIRDRELLEPMAARGKVPTFGIGVETEEVFLHCPKAFIRSSLWDATRAGGERPIPSFARMLLDHTGIQGVTEEELTCEMQERLKTTL
jgi:PPOX class probable FMN-dependent enzyme